MCLITICSSFFNLRIRRTRQNWSSRQQGVRILPKRLIVFILSILISRFFQIPNFVRKLFGFVFVHLFFHFWRDLASTTARMWGRCSLVFITKKTMFDRSMLRFHRSKPPFYLTHCVYHKFQRCKKTHVDNEPGNNPTRQKQRVERKKILSRILSLPDEGNESMDVYSTCKRLAEEKLFG